MTVVTFHTTAEAFAFEALCQEQSVPGKLGTVPRSLSAGCGFAWVAPDEAKDLLERLCSLTDHDALHAL